MASEIVAKLSTLDANGLCSCNESRSTVGGSLYNTMVSLQSWSLFHESLAVKLERTVVSHLQTLVPFSSTAKNTCSLI